MTHVRSDVLVESMLLLSAMNLAIARDALREIVRDDSYPAPNPLNVDPRDLAEEATR